MLPTEQFSGDATEDKSLWTPQVWRDGPDGIVQQAQMSLWQDRSDIELGALGPSTDAPSFDSVSQGANESELTVNPSQPPEGQGRATQWKNTLNAMRAVNPLAGHIKSLDYDPAPGDANPAP
jgi:hypothetical protein